MQTESRTYRKGRMLALPVAKPGAKAGRGGGGEGERSQRNREDKRQLSDTICPPPRPAHRTGHPSRPAPAAPSEPGPRTGNSPHSAHALIRGDGKATRRHPEWWSQFHLHI